MVEIFYRRCCKEEAEMMLKTKGLVEGRAPTSIYGTPARSEPYKWISTSRKFIKIYNPSGFPKEAHRFCAVLYGKDGLTDALTKYRKEGVIKKGPRGGYGIPPELREWFNEQIEKVEIYDLHTTPLPPIEGMIEPKMHLLKNKETGYYATFIAFPSKFIDYIDYEGKLVKINERLNRKRTTWVKTSLLWLIWRSNWGKEENQEIILKRDIPPEYMEFLFNEAIPTKDKRAKEADIICQYDPDRKIIDLRWNENKEDYFAKGGKTVHFGVRGDALKYYLGIDEYEGKAKIEDITPIIREILKEKPSNPEQTLYERIKLEVMTLK